MKTFTLLAAIFVLIALGRPEAVAQDADAIEQLLESADYWKQRGRYDKAAELWQKALNANPNHSTALAELASYYAASGKEETAKKYLGRLEQAHPGHSAIPSIQRRLQAGAAGEGVLDQARELSRQGKKQEALVKYREYFGGTAPTGSVALEYYQTLGGMSGGWAEARDGLARLVREYPGDPRMALAQARHLTYNEGTRRQGIGALQGLSGDARVGAEARSSWKMALLWLHASRADESLFRSYLSAAGDDAAVRQRLESLTNQPVAAVPNRLDEGYVALQREKLDEADDAFNWAMKQNGNNADALVGLALVQMRKQDFEAAVKLLEEARRIAPKRPEKWEQSLRSARFWAAIRAGEKALEAGDYPTAENQFRQAQTLAPEEAIHADQALGNLYARQERFEPAAELFRRVLDRDANHVGALQAMVQLLLAQGLIDAARVFNDRLALIEPAKALSPRQLQAEALRAQAAVERRVGDLRSARDRLNEARGIDPANKWVLFDLVLVQRDLTDYPTARALMNELLALDGQEPAFVLANARLFVDEGKKRRALEAIAAATQTEHNAELADFRRELEVRIEAENAVRSLREDNDGASARAKLTALQQKVDDSPRLTAIVSLAWADLNEFDRALATIRVALAATSTGRASIELQMAAILLKAERYEEMLTIVKRLRDDPSLSARERADVKNLRIAFAVRRADQLRDAGDNAGALMYLRPLLEEHREDPRLLAGLGRVFIAAGRSADAEKLFALLLRENQNNLEARQGAINAALAQNRNGAAWRLVAEGLALMPDDPRMHLIAARVHLTFGHDYSAMRELKEALNLTGEHGRQAEADEVQSILDSIGDNPETELDRLVFGAAGAIAESADRGPRGELRAEIAREMERIDARFSTDIHAYPNFRYRDGEKGFGRLTEVSAKVGVGIPTGYAGRINFEVTPVYLSSGALNLTQISEPGSRFGSYALFPANDTEDVGRIANAVGAGLELGYQYRGYRLYVGSSPLGFELPTPVGGLVLSDQINSFAFKLEGYRQAVTDSVLSYAGIDNPITGKPWGGVTRNGGQLDLAVDVKPVLFYVFGGYDFLMGTEVLDNTMWKGGAGLRWTAYQSRALEAITGLGASAFGYEENLRFFTIGHGGYFSPQSFVGAGAPLELRGRNGKVSYGLQALVGINWYSERSVDYFPNDTDLQAALETRVDAQGDPVDTRYEGNDDAVSFAMNAGANLGYAITPSFETGVDLAVYSAREYTEFIGKLLLIYNFRKTMPSERRRDPLDF